MNTTSVASKKAVRRRRQEPLDVRLTVSYRFGEAPEDRITMIDDRSVPMAGSVFRYRDAIVRHFAFMTLRAGTSSPSVLAELIPPLRWLSARGKTRDADDE